MRIRMLAGKRMAGEVGNFGAGQELEMPDAAADALIEGGYAERVAEAPVPTAVEPEAAAIEPDAETATLPKARKRKTSKPKARKAQDTEGVTE